MIILAGGASPRLWVQNRLAFGPPKPSMEAQMDVETTNIALTAIITLTTIAMVWVTKKANDRAAGAIVASAR